MSRLLSLIEENCEWCWTGSWSPDGSKRMGYSTCHISGAILTHNLEHTTAFAYKLLLHHLTALGPVVAFKLIPNHLRTRLPGSMINECAMGNLCLWGQAIMIWSAHQLRVRSYSVICLKRKMETQPVRKCHTQKPHYLTAKKEEAKQQLSSVKSEYLSCNLNNNQLCIFFFSC